MFIRVCLVLTIVAALAAAGINFLQVHRKISATIAERNQVRLERDQEAAANLEAQKLAGLKQAKLVEATRELAVIKDEREQAVDRVEEQTKRVASISQDLGKAQKERDRSNEELAAWKSLDASVLQIKPILVSLKTITEECARLTAEKQVLLAESRRLERLLAETLRVNGKSEDFGEDFVALPEGLKGRVLVTDPKHNFVLLDIGEKQGVLEAGQLLVNRGGKLVAKVVIKHVESNRSIADVMPGWKLDALKEGDQVLY